MTEHSIEWLRANQNEIADAFENANPYTFADGPSGLIARYVRIGELGDEGVRYSVRAARLKGMSWQKIADALGITRQSARKRYKDVVSESA